MREAPPKQDSAAAVENSRMEPQSTKGDLKIILVIEDHKLIRRSLDEALTRRGFVVLTAENGFEAVSLYRQFQSAVDLVLSDVQMPIMDGRETFDALREINPLVRYCFMTADSRISTFKNLLEFGALQVFAKPFPSVGEVANELWTLASAPPAIVRSARFSITEQPLSRETSRFATQKRGIIGWIISAVIGMPGANG